MKFPQIAHRVYDEPWMIESGMYQRISDLLQSRIQGADIGDISMAERIAEDRAERLADVRILASERTAIVPVFGVIGKRINMLEAMSGGVDIDAVMRDLEAAVANSNNDSVVMMWDSPGGTVTGIPEAAERVRELSEQKNIISFTDSKCCSAAYYVASQTREIVVTPSSHVGSIGVIVTWLDPTQMMQAQGIERRVFFRGRLKPLGLSGHEMTQEEIDYVEAQVGHLGDSFVETVLAVRPDVDPEAMEGQSFFGDQAVANGLADRVVARIEDLFG